MAFSPCGKGDFFFHNFEFQQPDFPAGGKASFQNFSWHPAREKVNKVS